MILYCSCNDETQDEMHGKGRRVHNPLGKTHPKERQKWRCAKCLDVKGGPEEEGYNAENTD